MGLSLSGEWIRSERRLSAAQLVSEPSWKKNGSLAQRDGLQRLSQAARHTAGVKVPTYCAPPSQRKLPASFHVEAVLAQGTPSGAAQDPISMCKRDNCTGREWRTAHGELARETRGAIMICAPLRGSDEIPKVRELRSSICRAPGTSGSLRAGRASPKGALHQRFSTAMNSGRSLGSASELKTIVVSKS